MCMLQSCNSYLNFKHGCWHWWDLGRTTPGRTNAVKYESMHWWDARVVHHGMGPLVKMSAWGMRHAPDGTIVETYQKSRVRNRIFHATKIERFSQFGKIIKAWKFVTICAIVGFHLCLCPSPDALKWIELWVSVAAVLSWFFHSFRDFNNSVCDLARIHGLESFHFSVCFLQS